MSYITTLDSSNHILQKGQPVNELESNAFPMCIYTLQT